MVFALIFALAIAVVAVFFALENAMMVTVSFFGYEVIGSLALFILLSVGIGVLIGVVLMLPGRIKSSLSNTRNRKKIGSLESNLNDHKAKVAELNQPVAPKNSTPKK